MLEIKTGTITDGASYSTVRVPSEEHGGIKSGTPAFHADADDSKEQAPSRSISLSDFKNGEVIGKYKILDKIGSGGMGEVFLVQHLNLNVRRAIKVIKPEILTKTGMRERFRHEAEAVARLNNPHIITVHDYEEINGIPCIEMEYFESRSLRSEMKRGVPLKAQRVLQIVDNITCGLEAAHKASPVPMIHRDLKPENVLISLNDMTLLKIIDFGLVKVMSGDLELTSTSVPMGTPYYMAPEQINAGKTGPATDIYALGVILFEMVTGKKPFEKDSYIEILNQHLKSTVPSAHALNTSYPESIDAVISRAMEKDPLNRFSDAREFYRELSQVLHDMGEPPSDDPLAKTL
jgi:serine/threonine-protein kinase